MNRNVRYCEKMKYRHVQWWLLEAVSVRCFSLLNLYAQLVIISNTGATANLRSLELTATNTSLLSLICRVY